MAHLSLQDGTYTAAAALLGERSSRKIGHNTVLHRVDSDRIAVRYHATDVYTMTADGWAIIDTGGWRTSTTSQRVRALLPGPWNVTLGGDRAGIYSGGHLVTPYADGIAVGVEGAVLGSIGFAPERYRYGGGFPGVLMTPEQVADVITAAEQRAEVRAAKRAARILAQHPEPRPITYRADVPHSQYGTDSPLPSPHGSMSQWRAAGECDACRAERDAWRVIRQDVLRADHVNGHAYSVNVNGATISAPAGPCPWDCPDRPARGW